MRSKKRSRRINKAVENVRKLNRNKVGELWGCRSRKASVEERSGGSEERKGDEELGRRKRVEAKPEKEGVGSIR